jgi:hypothetical protein
MTVLMWLRPIMEAPELVLRADGEFIVSDEKRIAK